MKFKPVLDRLAMAVQDKELNDYVFLEDDFIAELDQYYDSIEEERKLKEIERAQKEEERAQKEAYIHTNNKLVKFMLLRGVSILEIAEITNLSIDQIDAIRNSSI
jgi:uncharacterized membrane protein